MHIIDVVTGKMDQNREDNALIRKLKNNDIYADKERDDDLNEKISPVERRISQMNGSDYL